MLFYFAAFTLRLVLPLAIFILRLVQPLAIFVLLLALAACVRAVQSIRFYSNYVYFCRFSSVPFYRADCSFQLRRYSARLFSCGLCSRFR